jgi:hypothetical protein
MAAVPVVGENLILASEVYVPSAKITVSPAASVDDKAVRDSGSLMLWVVWENMVKEQTKIDRTAQRVCNGCKVAFEILESCNVFFFILK